MDSISDLEEFEKLNLQARCREILHQCYNFGFEVMIYKCLQFYD